jgi:hypothetical protein
MPSRTPLAVTFLLLQTLTLFTVRGGEDERSSTVTGSNPVLSMNLIGFDAVTGDLRARHNLRIPASEVWGCP